MCSFAVCFIRRTLSVLLVLVLLGGLASTWAAPQMTVGDPGNENGWVYGAGPTSTIRAIAFDSTGNLYMGGDFSNVGNRVTKFDGSIWSAVGSGLANNRVQALVVVSETLIYAGGTFNLSGSTPITGVARWDGTAWSNLCNDTNCGVTGGTNDVRALVVDGAGNLYAGGVFTAMGGVTVNRIAKWNPAANGGAGAWSALGSGCDGTVTALAYSSAGNLYVGGSFGSCGGVASTGRIAMWDGAQWTAVGSGIDDGTVNAVALDGAGKLYACGTFTAIGTVPVTRTAQFAGTVWLPMGGGLNSSATCRSLTVDSANNVYACGNIATANDGATTVNHITKWNGSTWSALGLGLGSSNACNVLGFQSGHVYAGGGALTSAWGVTYGSTQRVARWTAAEGRAVGGAGDYAFYSPTSLVTVTLPVTVSVTTAGDLARINIQRFNKNHPNALAPLQTGYYWQIEGLNAAAGVASGFTANMTLPANGFTPDNQDMVCSYAGGEWSCNANSYNAASVTRNGVTSFSDWAVGNDVGLLTVTLTLTSAGTGSGTVTSDPAGINCGSTCSADFNYGTVVTLTAAPAGGSTFVQWTGACTGSGMCVVGMDMAKSVGAVFSSNAQPMLFVSKDGSGTGIVTSNPPGVDCGITCTADFAANTVVTLTATPTGGSLFDRWSGACAGSDACVVTMDAVKQVTATFILNTLGVHKTGSGSGTVTSEPAGINCGSVCTANFDQGTVVTLTASPTGGSIFTGWSGACAGGDLCVVTMTASASVTATFELNTLSVTKSGNGSGVVTSEPAGINCGATCSANFAYNAAVTLTAAPLAGDSLFAGWSGAGCSGTGDCVLTMTAPQTVTAMFMSLTQTLSVASTGNGGGVITSEPAGINCGGACSAGFGYGSVVTLTATPNGDSTFFKWSGACSGQGVCVVPVMDTTNVTATFTFNYPLPFTDDFESGAGKWTADAGSWSAVTDDTQVYSQTNPSGFSRSVTGSPTWSDYAVTARVKVVNGTYAMLMTRYQDSGHYYFMALRLNNGKIEFKKMLPSGSVGLGSSASQGFVAGTWYTATFEVVGTTLRAYINGNLVYTATDPMTTPPYSTGMAGLGTLDARAEFDDVNIVSLVPVYTLTVSTAGSGTGSVTSVPAGIDCGATCSAGFERGTLVTLVATPTVGSSLAGWQGACTGEGACVVTMDMAKSVTAVFATPSQPVLVVNRAGNGTGSITSVPTGIDCGLTCTAAFAQNTVVTLTATATNYSVFSGWSGGTCSGTGACEVALDASKNVTATFVYLTYPLTVAKAGNGAGTVTSVPPAISCGVTCTAQVGGLITLTATPAPMSSFTGWEGAGCTGTGPCVLVMDAAKSVTATFRTYTTFMPIIAAYIAPVTVAPVYVALTGTDSNPGTLAQPFKTLDKAVSVVVPGQTIYVRGGVYSHTETISLTKNANSVNMLKIWAYPGEKPVLDFAAQPYTTTARGFYVDGSYWHLKGLEIQNAGDNGIYIIGHHNIIENCVLHHNRDTGLQISNGGAYNQVINCDSYRNYDPPDGSDADGFAAKLNTGPGNVFQGCRAWENADDGWDLFDTNNAAVILDSWTWHNGDRLLWGVPMTGTWGGNGNGFKVGGNGNHAANVLKNCIAFDHVYGTGSDTKGFDLNGNRSGISVTNSLGFSNTINYAFGTQPDDGTHHTLKNNVGFGGTKANNLSADTIQIANSWNLTVTANLDDYLSLLVSQATAPRQADGSLPTGFARLVAGSDLIDQGVDVGLPFCRAKPDLGPFEVCP